MLLNFCPQCGFKLQTGFRFCPSCGEKLPCPVDPPGSPCPEPVETASFGVSQLDVTDAVTTTANTSPSASASAQPTVRDAGGLICSTPSPVSARPALRRTRDSERLRQGTEVPSNVATPPHTSSLKRATDVSPKSVVSPRKRRAVTTQVKPIKEEEATDMTVSSPVARTTAATVSSPVARARAAPVSSPTHRSPATVKGKGKKTKRASAVEPLQEEEELSDTTGRKWRLLKLLGQSEAELIYAVQQSGPGSSSSSSNYKHILKLGAKDGRIFNEQNFLQRAAKPSSVDKWMKHTKTDFIGLPSCVGFGLHAEAYRFLIFPNMGQTLQSVMEEEEEELLPEAAVLQLACRILDVLEFIHENEYVHADIQAENIYIHPAENTQVYLAGYCHAFRYCPGGRHVEYREGSRTPHEGALEFISLESHKGAGPSRRSDLQALGYCLLRWHTGILPWSSLTHTPSRVAAEKQRFMEDVPGLLSHCYGKKTVSRAVQSYLSQVMSLQYCEQPDYQALREGLHAALKLLGGSLEQPLSLQQPGERVNDPVSCTPTLKMKETGTLWLQRTAPSRGNRMFTGSTKNPPPKSPQPERLDEVYAALRRGLQSYLQVHQLELDSLGQQIRESKRNGRLGFLYELDKQVKAIERFMRRLEFHLSKVEELYDAYCMQRRLRDGASKMVAAFNSASGSKEARESLSEANRGYREYTEHMCSLENELEGQMGEFHIKMKGLAGFARLCAGDQYEVLMRAGRQRWRLRGRVEGSGRQVWDSEEYVFLPLITELLSIKVTELKSLANHVVVGSVSCETLDLFCPLPQTVAVDINDLGTVKLNLEVTWSPFDKDDQTSSTSTVSKRFLSNQSPPDTPSMREQVFYSLLKRQGELENGTVWSNSSESSDDSSSPAMGHHAHRMMATPTLQTTPTIQISFNPRQSSASTPSLSSNQEEDEPEAAEGLGEVDSVKWAVPNGHQCSRSLSHIDDTSVDSTVTGRPLAQSPGLARTPEPLGQSHPEGSCSGQKSEALDLPECDASGGFRADSENPGGMAQAPVLQATDSALGKGLREEQSSKKDNQRQQSTQPQELGQGLRLPEETLKGYHSRSSSFSQDIETALESFDFLNCSDLDDEEGEEEKQMKEDGEEQEQLKEEGEELKKEEESIDYAESSQECEGEEEMEIFVEAPEGFRNCDCAPPDEDDCSSQPQENTGEEATWQDEEEEEDKDEEWKEGEKEEDKEEWEEEVKDEKDKREEWEEKNEEEKDQKEGQVEEEKEEWEEKKEEEKDKKEGWVEEKDKKEEQEVEQKDKKEEQENVEEEEETQREKDEEKEEEITETDPSKQEHGEETFHDEEARPSTPSHLATTVL